VTANADLDLFWALRGAGANFGVVTAMEVDLFPVASLLGGGLYFGAGESEEVVHAYVDWARDVPETMASSILLIGYPDLPEVPAALRGQHVTHVRIAYSGNDRVVGHRLVERLRGIGPRLLDTVRVMPYAEVGSIHDEPTDEPVAAYDRNVLLRDLDHDAATVLSRHAGPAAKPRFITELRAWGGALCRPAAIPNAVGSRDTAYSLLAISEPAQGSRSSRDQMLAAMHPWSTGRTYLNFAGVEDTALDSVRRAYSAQDFARLQELKASYDPRNMFRINFNIPPTSRSVRVALTRKGL
jgi:FAD/FMN-containing dehydrogenase